MNLMIFDIYEALKANPLIAQKVGASGIKMYQVEEDIVTKKPFILIAPLNPSTNAYFGGNSPLSKQFAYQINVESTDLYLVKEISDAIQKTMWQNGFGQLAGGLDEYFEETKRYVEAKRYRKNTNINDLDIY